MRVPGSAQPSAKKRPVNLKKKRIVHRGARSLRPLRAVGSLYEPEAIGPSAYAPVGERRVNLSFRFLLILQKYRRTGRAESEK